MQKDAKCLWANKNMISIVFLMGVLILAGCLQQSSETTQSSPPTTPIPTPEEPNNPPEARAQAPLSVDVDGDGAESVMLDASASRDDGQIVKYEWFEGEQKLGEGKKLEAKLGVGEHTVKLVVTDDKGAKSESELKVKVLARPESMKEVKELFKHYEEKLKEVEKVKIKHNITVDMSNYFDWIMQRYTEDYNKDENTYIENIKTRLELMKAFAQIDGKSTIYKYKDITKRITTANIIGISTTTIVIEKGDKVVTCSEQGIALTEDGSRVHCSIGKTDDGMDFLSVMYIQKELEKEDGENVLEKFTLEEVKNAEVAKRKCIQLTMYDKEGVLLQTPSQDTTMGRDSNTESAIYEELKKNTAWKIETCLDNELGMTLLLNMKWIEKNTEKTLIEISAEATEISFDVTPEKVKPPLKFSIDANCESETSETIDINIIAFKDLSGGTASLKILPYTTEKATEPEYETTFEFPSIGFANAREVSVDVSKAKPEGYKKLEVCIKDDCATDSCYFFPQVFE